MNGCFDELYLKVEVYHGKALMRGLEKLFAKSGWAWIPATSRESPGSWIFPVSDEKRNGKYSVIVDWIDPETLQVSNVLELNNGISPTPQKYNSVIRRFHEHILTGMRLPFPIVVWWRDGMSAARGER